MSSVQRLFPSNFFEILTCVSILGLTSLKFSPFFFTALVVAIVYQWITNKDWRELNLEKFAFLGISLPFLLTILGLLNTQNFKQAFEDLGRVAPYLLLPLLASFIPGEHWKQTKKKWLVFFIIGLFIHFGVNLFIAFFAYMNDHQWHHFFYTYLNRDTNVLSVTIAVTALVLMEKLVQNHDSARSRSVFFIVAVSLLALYLLLLQSRIVILVFVFGYLVLWFLKGLKISLTFGIPLLFMGTLLLFAPFRGRFQEVSTTTSVSSTSLEEKSDIKRDTLEMDCMGSKSLRLNALIASKNLIFSNPIIGVGSGDWRDELTRYYHKNQLPCNAKEQTAPHNQYLRIALKNGFLGLGFFLMFLVLAWKIVRKNSNLGTFSFLFILTLTAGGYDVLDVGTAAPVMAFFATIFFYRQS